MPGVDRLSIAAAVEEAGEIAALGIPAVLLFGIPAAQGRARAPAPGTTRASSSSPTRAIKARPPGPPRHHRRLPVRVHRPRPLRRAARRRRGRQRRDARAARAHRGLATPRAGADVVAPSDMMDGRVGAIRARARRRGLRPTRRSWPTRAKFASAFYGPFREAADSTPAFGDRRGYQMDPGQRRRGVREALLDVEEGADIVMVKPALPYLDVIRRVKDATRPARRRLQRQRRVRDGQGGRRGRAASTSARRARGAHRRSAAPAPTSSSPTTRRTPPDGCQTSDTRRSARARTAPRSRSTSSTSSLLNLMQGSFPIAPRPYAAVAELAGVAEDEVLARVQHLLDERIIRQVTPIYDTRALGYGSMLVAAKVDPEHPWRAAKIINSHPGVTHNYLRNHEFNMWFTIAVEADSQARPRRHARRAAGADRRRVDPPAADAQAVQDPHGPRDGGRHRGARRPPARPSSRSSSRRQAYDDPTSPSSAPRRATCRSPSPTRTRRASSACPRPRCSRTSTAWSSAGCLRRVAAILFHRRAGFSANGMGVWRAPDDKIAEYRGDVVAETVDGPEQRQRPEDPPEPLTHVVHEDDRGQQGEGEPESGIRPSGPPGQVGAGARGGSREVEADRGHEPRDREQQEHHAAEHTVARPVSPSHQDIVRPARPTRGRTG